ncbi:MAG: hypothetical protein ACFCU7_10240 [Pleurocapsa sp.]
MFCSSSCYRCDNTWEVFWTAIARSQPENLTIFGKITTRAKIKFAELQLSMQSIEGIPL